MRILLEMINVGSVAHKGIVYEAFIALVQTVGNFEHQLCVANADIDNYEVSIYPIGFKQHLRTHPLPPKHISITAHHEHYTIRPLRQYSPTASTKVIIGEPLWTLLASQTRDHPWSLE